MFVMRRTVTRLADGRDLLFFDECPLWASSAGRATEIPAEAVEAAFAGAGFGPPRCFTVKPGGGALRSSPPTPAPRQPPGEEVPA